MQTFIARAALFGAVLMGGTLLIGCADGIHPPSADDDAVAATAPTAHAGDAPPSSLIEVPLRVADGRLLVTVEEGLPHPIDFILGTGSGVTVLAASLAEHLGAAPDITLGGVPVVMDDFVTRPDDELAVTGATVGGLIGGNTLNQVDLLVDVAGGRLLLQPVSGAVSWPDVALSAPVRMRVYHGIALSFDVELDGQPYPATLDLGTPTLVVNAGVQTAAGLADEDTATLKLGAATLDDVPVRVLDLDVLQRWAPDGRGFVIVGAPVAYDCALAISYVHQELRTCVR